MYLVVRDGKVNYLDFETDEEALRWFFETGGKGKLIKGR